MQIVRSDRIIHVSVCVGAVLVLFFVDQSALTEIPPFGRVNSLRHTLGGLLVAWGYGAFWDMMSRSFQKSGFLIRFCFISSGVVFLETLFEIIEFRIFGEGLFGSVGDLVAWHDTMVDLQSGMAGALAAAAVYTWRYPVFYEQPRLRVIAR